MPDHENRGRGLAAALLTLVAVAGWTPGAAAELVNRVVLRVNDRIATLYDYESRKQRMEEDMVRADLPLARRRELVSHLPESVFQDLYQELLLQSRADQLGIVFTDQEIDEQVQRMRQYYGFDDLQAFEQALATSGLTLNDFREQTRVQMRMNGVVDREVRSKLAVSEDLARRFYKEHTELFETPQRMNLREIVVLDDSGLSAEERLALARSLRAELAGGRDLAAIAAEHSAGGETSAVHDLGWVAGGDLASELEQGVWNLSAGQVSAPIESRGGLHLVEVVERQDAGLQPFTEVAEKATEAARREAMGEAMQEYLARLEKQAYLQVEPPPEAADFRRLGADTTALDALDSSSGETGGEAPAGPVTGDAAVEASAAEAAAAANRAEPLAAEADEPLEKQLSEEAERSARQRPIETPPDTLEQPADPGIDTPPASPPPER